MMSRKKEDTEREPMRYGVLGADASTEEEKLDKYQGVAGWEYLKPHLENGTMIYVDPGLDIVEVARAFLKDDMEKVTQWLGKGDLVKPSEPHAKEWDRTLPNFRAVVVSPFVLATLSD